MKSIKLCSVAMTAILLAALGCSGDADTATPQPTVAGSSTSLSELRELAIAATA